MPDANGQFKGIAVPPLPWLQHFRPGDRVRITATQQHGTIAAGNPYPTLDGQVWYLVDGEYYTPGELRPVTT